MMFPGNTMIFVLGALIVVAAVIGLIKLLMKR